MLAQGADHSLRRHTRFLITLALLLLASVALWLFATFYLDRPPARRAAADLVHGQLYAYEVREDTPYVVFQREGGSRLVLDRLRLDWISIEFPPTPAWQLSRDAESIELTGNPASAGVGRHGCCSLTLFGQITPPEIRTLEVEHEGQRRSFAVSAPGFLVQLDSFEGEPAHYRWLKQRGSARLVSIAAASGRLSASQRPTAYRQPA